MQNRAIARLIKKYKKQIFFLFLLNFLSSGFLIIGPYFSKLFFDKIFIGKDPHKFLILSVWGAGVFVFCLSVRAAGDIAKDRLAAKVRLDLASRFIRKLYSIDLASFQLKSVGESVYRLSDTERVVSFILEQCPNVLADVLRLTIILGIAFWINTRMAVFLMVLSPGFLLHSAYLQKKIRVVYGEIWKHSALIASEVHEAFSRIVIIKALGLESHKRHLYLKALIKNIRWKVTNVRWTVIGSLISSTLSKAIYGALTVYGGWLVMRGEVTIGSYTAALLYLAQSGELLQSLSGRFIYLEQEAVSVDKFIEIMDIRPGIRDLPGAVNPKALKGEITFRDVWFGYDEARPILKGINFTIPGCCWTALAGPSGCGKTTVIYLILRLYDPLKGGVFLDGRNILEMKMDNLRKRIRIATQQPFLFDVAVRENIAYGQRDVSEAEICEAARISCVDEFINQLPQGYDTRCGEDACCFSHGMKQRIAIARAIIKNPDVLILDEATSSIDSVTEQRIFKMLREKREGRSTIVISHQVFSIREADRVYFFGKGGQAIDEGSHSELLAGNPAYRDFFMA